MRGREEQKARPGVVWDETGDAGQGGQVKEFGSILRLMENHYRVPCGGGRDSNCFEKSSPCCAQNGLMVD